VEAIKLLENYKKRLEPRLRKYFSEKIKQAGKVDPMTKQSVKIIADFALASGKRIRPALVYYGYLAAGGEDGTEIVEASMGMELIHSFLLIHDDIIDRDEKRHGVPTVHEIYKKFGKQLALKKDCEHFGNSMAIIAGDMAAAMANEIIFNADFPPKIIIKALDKLQNIVYVTIPGEMLDVVMSARGRTTEKEILKMFEGKTSRYTFEGPLHLGGILAGGDSSMLEFFTAYSLPLGKAFQIHDDILGMFGDEKKLGKPVGSDIIEGKQTILILKALEKGNRNQRLFITDCLGKKDLKKDELNEIRQIVKNTGSLAYSRELAKNFVEESLVALKKADIKNKEAEKFLFGLAEYMIAREV
jgi:geranylgeranyl diphosphate synthase type I